LFASHAGIFMNEPRRAMPAACGCNASARQTRRDSRGRKALYPECRESFRGKC